MCSKVTGTDSRSFNMGNAFVSISPFRCLRESFAGSLFCKFSCAYYGVSAAPWILGWSGFWAVSNICLAVSFVYAILSLLRVFITITPSLITLMRVSFLFSLGVAKHSYSRDAYLKAIQISVLQNRRPNRWTTLL
jgi:hypothetical protein